MLTCWQKSVKWNARPVRHISGAIGEQLNRRRVPNKGIANLDTHSRRITAEKMWQTSSWNSSFASSFDRKIANRSVFESQLGNLSTDNVSRRRARSHGDDPSGYGWGGLSKPQPPRLHSHYNPAHPLSARGPTASVIGSRTALGNQLDTRAVLADPRGHDFAQHR